MDNARFRLLRFHEQAYHHCERRTDALSEMLDALLTLPANTSPAHMMLLPGFQRRWGSVYDALGVGQMNQTGIEDLLTQYPLDGDEAVYACDSSTWIKNDAETSPRRGYYHHHNRHSAGKPVVAGWSYQWLAQVSFQRDSWSAPLSARRVDPAENMHHVAASQVHAMLHRCSHSGEIPIFVFDAGYDAIQLVQALGDTRAALLVRLRAGRCFYADPTAQPRTGRPRRHGHKFACDVPATWPTPDGDLTVEDEQYGTVRVRAWRGLHPKTQGEHAQRDVRGRRPIVRGTLLLVEVSRLPQQTREPQDLWLWWYGPRDAADAEVPNLDRAWRAYVRRFDLEHTFRFLKQTLNWTLPRVRHPEQADRWTWLVVLAYTQLRLARPLADDQPLPWQQAQPPGKLTPARVRRAFSLLLPHLPVLVCAPKPCGRSPGRPKGKRSGRAPRYPALTKALLSASHVA
jgi:Transposase DDE domain